jgi:hypothetical protein
MKRKSIGNDKKKDEKTAMKSKEFNAIMFEKTNMDKKNREKSENVIEMKKYNLDKYFGFELNEMQKECVSAILE